MGRHGARKVECWRRCAGQWFSDGARTLRQIESEMVRKSRDWVRPRYCYKTMGGMQWCDLGGPADPCEDIVLEMKQSFPFWDNRQDRLGRLYSYKEHPSQRRRVVGNGCVA